MRSPGEVYGGTVGTGTLSTDLLIDYYLDLLRGTDRVSPRVKRRLEADLERINEGIRKFESILWHMRDSRKYLILEQPHLAHRLYDDDLQIIARFSIRNDRIEVRFEYTGGIIPESFLLIGDIPYVPHFCLEAVEHVSDNSILVMLERISHQLQSFTEFESSPNLDPASDAIVYTLRKIHFEKSRVNVATN